jgi:hypothetical protein
VGHGVDLPHRNSMATVSGGEGVAMAKTVRMVAEILLDR